MIAVAKAFMEKSTNLISNKFGNYKFNCYICTMKRYEVTLFIMGLPLMNMNNTRVVEIEANSQEEAEQKAHDWYISDGWGVYDSKEI